MIEAARLFVKVGSDTREGEAGLTSFNDKLTSTAQKAAVTGGLLSASITAPLVMLGKSALTMAGDFEQSLNITQQVTGASDQVMQTLTDSALKWGAETSFSAGEVADGMQELGKAGLVPLDILAAMPGVMDLAAAGNTSLANASSITTAALNAFSLEASESTRIANMLAAAANASSADITDLAQGFQQAGFAFSATGQGADDLAAALAILTNVGLTGSDAGTALKNAMTRLMDPTTDAVGAMRELGIITGDTSAAIAFLNQQGITVGDDLQAAFAQYAGFTDSVDTVGGWIPVSVSFKEDKEFQKEYQKFLGGFTNNTLVDETTGQFKSLAEIIDILNQSMAGMAPVERNAALANIFLSDGMKAMIPLLEVGADGFLAMKDTVNEEGAAARVAEARMKGLTGAVEYFQGSVDSFLITTAQPYLNMLGNIVRKSADLLTTFGQMSPSVRNAGLAFLGVLAVAGPLLVGLGAVAGALAFVLSPIGAVIAASALLASAWAGDFWGIQQVTSDVFGAITDTVGGWWDKAEPYVTAAKAAFDVLWAGATGQGDVTTVLSNLDTITSVFGPELSGYISDAGLALANLVTSAKGIDDIDLNALWNNTKSFASKLDSKIQATLGLEIDWSQIAVNTAGMVSHVSDQLSTANWGEMAIAGQGMVMRAGAQLSSVSWSDMTVNAKSLVTRAQEQLSALDWTAINVNFGSLLSVAGQKITEQADKYLGADNLISRTVERITGALGSLGDTFDGASIDAPLDLLRRGITGAIGIYSLVGSIKTDVATTAVTDLQSLLTGALNFAKGITAGVDSEQIAQAATGLVTSFTDQIVAVTKPEQLKGLGVAAGGFVGTLIEKLGDTLGSEGFGEDVGTAVGRGTAAFLTGALALTAGIVGELATVDFSTLASDIQTFTGGFIAGAATEIAKGDYLPLANAILVGIGTALWKLIEGNPLNIFNMSNSLDKNDVDLPNWVPQLPPLGETQGQMLANNSFNEMSWASVGQQIADSFNETLEANPPQLITVGPDPIRSQEVDLMAQQEKEEEINALYGRYGVILATSALMTLGEFTWPGLDLASMGFEWPEIPQPQWWKDLLKWAGIAQDASAEASDYRDEAEDILEQVRNQRDEVQEIKDQVTPVEDVVETTWVRTVPMAIASDTGITVSITGPITIVNGMDIEELALEIIQRVRRGLG